MIYNIITSYENLLEEEFVEEYNRLFDTDLTVNDVKWNED